MSESVEAGNNLGGRLVTATFEVPDQGYAAFAQRIKQLGGTIISGHLEQTFIPERPEDLPSEMIVKSELASEARAQGINLNHTCRAWNVAREIMQHGDQAAIPSQNRGKKEAVAIDLAVVLAQIRVIEAGDSEYMWGLGQRYWNLFSALINNRLSKTDKPPLLLAWDPKIHADFRNGIDSRRSAATELETRYRAVEQAFAEKQMYPTLF